MLFRRLPACSYPAREDGDSPAGLIWLLSVAACLYRSGTAAAVAFTVRSALTVNRTGCTPLSRQHHCRPCTPAGCRGGRLAKSFRASRFQHVQCRSVYGAAACATVTALTDRRGRASSPAGRDRFIPVWCSRPITSVSVSMHCGCVSYSMPRRRSSGGISPTTAPERVYRPDGSLGGPGDTQTYRQARVHHTALLCPRLPGWVGDVAEQAARSSPWYCHSAPSAAV